MRNGVAWGNFVGCIRHVERVPHRRKARVANIEELRIFHVPKLFLADTLRLVQVIEGPNLVPGVDVTFVLVINPCLCRLRSGRLAIFDISEHGQKWVFDTGVAALRAFGDETAEVCIFQLVVFVCVQEGEDLQNDVLREVRSRKLQVNRARHEFAKCEVALLPHIKGFKRVRGFFVLRQDVRSQCSNLRV